MIGIATWCWGTLSRDRLRSTTASAQQLSFIGDVVSKKCKIACSRAVTENSCATVAKVGKILGGQQMDASLYTSPCSSSHAAAFFCFLSGGW